MLDGKKTVESRFSKNRILPYKQISKDDVVIVKKSGGDIVAYFTIKEVIFYDLNAVSIDEIKSNYQSRLRVDESFWIGKKDCNWESLIFIDKIFKIKPFRINKKGMQAWVKL